MVTGNNKTKSLLVGLHGWLACMVLPRRLLVLDASEYSSNYLGVPMKFCFSGLFFILNVAVQVERIISPHLSF
jgi:hypothetical protein